MIKRILRKNKVTSKVLETYFLSKFYLEPKGWQKSRYLHQSIDKNTNPLPWFTYSAINFLDNKLKIEPFRVFEFGSGNSTKWFSERVASVLSIESNEQFYKSQEKQFTSLDNVSVELVSERDYSKRILDFDSEFDIIIIDGIDRVNCTLNSLNSLKPDGIIIFDNSDREMYNKAYEYLEENDFKRIDFRGLAPISHIETQTTIYYRKVNCFNI